MSHAGSKKLTPAVPQGPQFVGKTPDDLAQAEAAARAAGVLPTQDELTVLMDVMLRAGRVQTALVIGNVSSRIIAEQYAVIAKSSIYEGIPYTAPDGSAKRVSSLNEFCEVFFGKCARRCQQLASNLDLLGPELYESAEKLGLGQRDYNALKALPADEQVVIKQALAEGADKESVVGMLTAIVERKAKELGEARAVVDARDARISSLIDRTNKAEARASDAAHAWKRATPDEQLALLLEELQKAAHSVRTAIALGSEEAGLCGAVLAVMQHAADHRLNVEAEVAGVLGGLINELRGVRDHDYVGVPALMDRRLAQWQQDAEG